MPNAETEKPTLLKLALISERAQREPNCQFTSLAHLLDERFLEHCYHRLGRDRASGIDGVTWQEYGENLEENLWDLVLIALPPAPPIPITLILALYLSFSSTNSNFIFSLLLI